MLRANVALMAEDNDAGGPEDLLKYLQQSREGVVRAVEGLGEFDRRRPMTPTATNLIGLVKHLAGVELAYLVESPGRSFEPRPVWMEDEVAFASGDTFALAEESSEEIIATYRAAWVACDASVRELGLQAPATVAWWGPDNRDTTLGSLLVRVVDETARHAGHADILRELIDRQAGQDHDRIGDADWWAAYTAQVEQAAAAHREG